MPSTSLGTLVTYNPWTVGPSALLDDVAAKFDELGVHHVSVVDADGRLLGILSETDILRVRQCRRAAVLVGEGGSETEECPPAFVKGAMTRDVVTIPPSALAADALAMLLRRRIHALPVVSDGKLIGIITSRDVLRELSYGEIPCSQRPVLSVLLEHAPEPLAPLASLDEALLAMNDSGVACLAVAQKGLPLGVLSQREIVRARCRNEDCVSAAADTTVIPTVAHVARRSPGVQPTQKLSEAAAIMIEHDLSAVTVVDPQGKLLGLVTEDDLLQVLYDEEA